MLSESKEYVNVVAFSQNLIIDSLDVFKEKIANNYPVLIVTSHELFENEKKYLNSIWENGLIFKTFASFLSDEDMENIDVEAYEIESSDSARYCEVVKKNKNRFIIEQIETNFIVQDRFVFSDDLGFVKECWIEKGYEEIIGDYYYKVECSEEHKPSIYRRGVNRLFALIAEMKKEVYSAKYKGKKYVFLGSMNRVNKRIDINFQKSLWEYVVLRLQILFYKKNSRVLGKNVIDMSALHEFNAWDLPERYPIALLQDGYLPPNYSSLYMKPNKYDVTYYVWDKMSCGLFINQNMKYQIMPFRKKVFLPSPRFGKRIRKVLIATSGAGDWTAMKNRSDEDKMVMAIGEFAKKHADIDFIYRCHPLWTHPLHQGVNSITRVINYFKYLGLSNLKVSSNIPEMNINNVKLSLPMTSLEKDMEEVDLIIGEHSVSMLDGALLGIPFISANFTGRRDFFCAITELGFPHCETLEELETHFALYKTEEYRIMYENAINNYNEMMDEE